MTQINFTSKANIIRGCNLLVSSIESNDSVNCYIYKLKLSMKGGKYQESIQSSTTPDPGCQMGK